MTSVMNSALTIQILLGRQRMKRIAAAQRAAVRSASEKVGNQFEQWRADGDDLNAALMNNRTEMLVATCVDFVRSVSCKDDPTHLGYV